MKQKVMQDISLECDYPGYVGRYERTMEGRAQALEEWAKELEEFIRDHRSRDDLRLNVKRIYEELCSFCGMVWEEGADGPLCCTKAQEEWDAAKNAVVHVSTQPAIIKPTA